MSQTEFAIDRPGYFLPWLCIITFDHSQQDYAWGVYHHDRTTRPVHYGHAPTKAEAREAAEFAVGPDVG